MKLITPKQKLAALAHKFYQGASWEPAAGDFYTSSRDDLELYQIVYVLKDKIATRYTEGDGEESLWDRDTFLTEGFGPKLVWVPDWLLDIRE